MDVFFLLAGAGLLAGAMNAVAGGGSFLTFPAMLYAGVPPIMANASSTVALYPGSLAGAWEYRAFLKPLDKVPMQGMILTTFVGGCLGAWLLLNTPSANFSQMVPWLLLIGSVVFAFGKDLGMFLKKRVVIGRTTVLFVQFLLGIYGGFFRGAVGIMMMAVWNVFGMTDIKNINANKNLLVAVANTVAVVLFIMAGKVSWQETLIMLVATTAGGYLGAYYSKAMNPLLIRRIIMAFNFIITLVFFIKTYLPAFF